MTETTTAAIFRIRYSNGSEVDVPVLAGQREYIFGRKTSRRSEEGFVPIQDPHVSQRHCRIFLDGADTWFVEDLASVNGTYLGDALAMTASPVPPATEIRMGATCVLILNTGERSFLPPVGGEAAVTWPGELGTGRQETLLLPTALAGEVGTRSPLPVPDVDEMTRPHRPPVFVGEEDTTRSNGRIGVTRAQSAATVVTTQKNPSASNTLADAGMELALPRPLVTVEQEEESGLLSREWRAPPEAGMDLAVTEPATAAPQPSSPPSVPHRRGMDRRREQRPFVGKDRRSGVDRRSVAGQLVFERVGNDPILQELLHANLIDERDARFLCGKAQAGGRTLLYLLATEPATRFWPEIYALIARKLGLPLLNQEHLLRDRAMETEWLDFNRAIQRGAVLLSGGPAGRTLVATLDPGNLGLEDWIGRQSRQPVDLVLAQADVFLKVMRQLKESVSRVRAEESGMVLDLSTDDEEMIRENLNDANIPQVVKYIIHRAHSQGASDIHIEPGEGRFVIRNRVDGHLHEEISLQPEIHQEVASRIKILAGMDVAEKRRPQDGRFALAIAGSHRHFDLRVSSYPTVYGEKFVLRLLDQSAVANALDGLGMLARDLQLLKDRINAPHGLILISGPTGSGKTTTLYSCLGFIDCNSRNILTVEDPVEYRMQGVHQMQVNAKIGLTFALGLRAILRQDPDVVMVGECRDQETAGMAVQASLTGHVVFSTIHTNDAVGVISRLLNMGLEPFMVANALTLAIAQRLIRVICPHCKGPVRGATILERLEAAGIFLKRLTELGVRVDADGDYVQGMGCRQCRNTGYKGRRAVFEILPVDATIRGMIIQPEFNGDELQRYAARQGMTTLMSHGLRLVEDEVTTFEEVVRVLGERY